jgi:hypothetical protein
VVSMWERNSVAERQMGGHGELLQGRTLALPVLRIAHTDSHLDVIEQAQMTNSMYVIGALSLSGTKCKTGAHGSRRSTIVTA